MERIRKDFDRIATLSEHEREVDGTYDRFLLRSAPARCARALEVGCGTGTFTRLLAGQADHVTAIDLSGEMIRIARERSTGYANIDYSVGDVLKMELPVSQFDCIVMVATLHHLPTGPALEKLKLALKPDGVLIIHDLLTPKGALERSGDMVRMPVSVAVRWLRTGRAWPRREVRKAWAEHGRKEQYLTKRGVKAMIDDFLPGGYVKYHLLWRYTIVWRKKDAA